MQQSSFFGIFFRPPYRVTTVSLFTASFIILFDNQLFWKMTTTRLGLDSYNHWFFVFALGSVLVLLFHSIFLLVAFRPVFKPFLVVVLLIAAGVSYFSDAFGVIIDKAMVHNILETDIAEASELLTWPLFRHLLLFGVLPSALLILTPVQRHGWRRELLTRVGVIAFSLLIIVALAMTSYKNIVLFGRQNRDLRVFINPPYPIYALNKVLKKKYFAQAEEPLQLLAKDAVRDKGQPPAIVVMVIGETARASEFAFNGYARDTNPYLGSYDVINYSDVEACGTSTAESLPCIFSPLGRDHFSRSNAAHSENLLNVLQHTGVKVVWLDNNSGSKGVAEWVDYEDLSRRDDARFCRSDNCYDEILLERLEELIGGSTADTLIVLHLKGSHGPSYYKRSPPAYKAFLPECTRDNVQDCPQQTIVNAYDNTIVYTDFVLARLVDLLKAQNSATAMLYVSDHGESLGENGIYLHGLPYALAPDNQTHVPMIFWGSDRFLSEKQIDLPALNILSKAHYSHDNLFHSMLGLFAVKTEIYRPELDMFAAVRGQ